MDGFHGGSDNHSGTAYHSGAACVYPEFAGPAFGLGPHPFERGTLPLLELAQRPIFNFQKGSFRIF